MAHLLARRRRTTIIAAVLGLCYVALLVTLAVLSFPSGTSVLTADGQFVPATGALSARPGALPLLTGAAAFFWGTVSFIPVGVFAYLTLPRWALPLSFLVGPALAISLQLLAWAAIPGQVADPLRWLCHAGGSALGVALAVLFTWLTARRHAPPVDSTRTILTSHTPSGAV